MFAVIKQGARQFTVKKGDVITVDRLEAETESVYEIKDVLAVSGDNGLKVGTPVVEGAVVKAKVLDHAKDKKILVYKRKPRKDYKKRYGHRSHITQLEITDITAG
ncbi:50S ribosomal protein L21 [Limisalsivibrio acetivorans]|uniref:50S ribosomal protein L21 n=1 Tax=Limisalsivibrio acetivorans TaxID=1304888 RepID=UPI0003B6B68E|nr:50S ribosomal protein L21 [Limisalsivibrio acetivorans]